MNEDQTEIVTNEQIAGVDYIRLILKDIKGEGDMLDRLPMALMLPHEAQCKETHGQTLKRVAERGGLDPVEALAIIEGWNPFTDTKRETQDSAYSKLTKIVSDWEGHQHVIGWWRNHSRRFVLNRLEDDSPLSVAGIVAQGIEWTNGEVVLHWHREGTTACYKGIGQLKTTIPGHEGTTVIEWID